MRIADLIIEALAHQGVDAIFGVPGGQTLELYHSLSKGNRPVRHFGMLDERSAAYAADAYARATGRIGVCDGTVGPGATNLVSGLAEALNSSSPLIAIVSELVTHTQHLADWGTASQGIDQIELLRPVCKMVIPLRQAHEANYVIRRAISAATSGRPGPVALIVAQDLLEAETVAPRLGAPQIEAMPPAITLADPAGISAAARVLLDAEKPVLLVGGGGVTAGAFAEVAAIAEVLGAPVMSTWTGKGIIPDGHPLALGVAGNTGRPGLETVLGQADVVLMIGAKSGQNSSFQWTLPHPGQKLVHVDVDPLETGRVFRTDVSLVGDARAVIRQLLDAVTSGQARSTQQWAISCREQVEDVCRSLQQAANSSEIPILPQRVVAEIGKAAGDDDMLVCDASFASGWGSIHFPIKTAGRRCIFPRGMAGLGFGLPAAIGASVAEDKRNIFLLAGDGGFAYSVQELAVAVRHALPVKSVVINNGAYGWIRHTYRSRYGSALEQDTTPVIDYASVAQGFGCPSRRITDPAQLGEAMQEAAAAKGPFLLEVMTSAEESPIMGAKRGTTHDPYAAKVAIPV